MALKLVEKPLGYYGDSKYEIEGVISLVFSKCTICGKENYCIGMNSDIRNKYLATGFICFSCIDKAKNELRSPQEAQ